jgi:recombination protein RecT
MNILTKNPLEEKKESFRRVIAENTKGITACLPKHIDFNRFARLCVNLVSSNPKLLDCSVPSLIGSIFKCSQLGLEPDGLLGQAYILPYKADAQLIIGYRGYIQLARQSGEISFIAGSCVYENDDLYLNYFDTPRFVPLIKGNRGEKIGAIAVARFRDGSYQWIYMNNEEIDQHRDHSPSWKYAKDKEDTIWHKYREAMDVKTAIRKLAKYLPLSTQKFMQEAEAIERTYDSGASYQFIDGKILEKENQEEVSANDALPNIEIQKSIQNEHKPTKAQLVLDDELPM